MARFQDGDLGEVAVHVQADEAHGSDLPAAVVLIGAAGQHDTYGSALAAHPGESQGRPRTNASSRLTNAIGLPSLRVPDAPVPDGRTIRRVGRSRRTSRLSYPVRTSWSARSRKSAGGPR